MSPDSPSDGGRSQIGGRRPLSGALPGWPRRLVVVEHAHGRRVDIVILARQRRPDEDAEGGRGEDQRQRQEDEHHRHGGASARVKLLARYELAITVMEDSGISTAATTGLIRPAMASATPAALMP